MKWRTHDNFMTFDQMTVDSSGAFLIGELERLDQRLHKPLVAVTWGRDIDLREDVTIGDEVSSFTTSAFAAGGIRPLSKNWVGKDTNAIPGVAVDIGKTAQPMNLWAIEVAYTIPELLSAQRLGRPVDEQKFEAMRYKHQMDIDEMVYIGDDPLGRKGLLNLDAVSPVNVGNGAAGTPAWSTKTPGEILADINTMLSRVWATSAWAVMPSELRVPPTQFGHLVSRVVSDAGNISLLTFLQQNSLSNAANGRPLNIQPIKWLVGRGVNGTDRMIAYTKDYERVRYPMTVLQRTPLEYRGLWQRITYYCRLGAVEVVYPETVGYADGI